MTDSTAGLKLSDYQFQALKADKSPEPSLAFPLLGLFGEAGSLLSVVKKKQRDKASYLGYAPNVIEEFGDVLWYFAVVASRGGIALADIANNINRGFFDWQDGGGQDLSFRSLQSSSSSVIRDSPTPEFENTLLELAGEIGAILSDQQVGRLSGNQAALKGRLVAVMRTLVKAADEAGVTAVIARTVCVEQIGLQLPRLRLAQGPPHCR